MYMRLHNIHYILNTIRLKEICYVNWGCRPSPSEKYVFNSFKECIKRTKNEDLCKKLIKGASIGRYFFNWSGKWLAYLKDMYNPMFPELFEVDRIIIKDIGINPIKSTYISGKEEIYYHYRSRSSCHRKWPCKGIAVDLKRSPPAK